MEKYFVQILLLLFIMVDMVWGTNRYYSDIVEYSSNGRFKVEATSPDNSHGEGEPFQDDFTYRLYDVVKGECLWKRKQPMEEASPVSLFVSDAGWVVIWTSCIELIMVGIDGRDCGMVDMWWNGLTKEEREKYSMETTAGPMWEGHSMKYFANYESKDYFVMRTWWSRRIIIDLEEGKLIRETEDMADILLQMEKDHILNKLEAATKQKTDWNDQKYLSIFSGAMTAAYMAGQIKMEEAVAYLRELEPDDFIGSSCVGGYDENIEVGKVDRKSYSEYSMRRIAQLSLRRLGQKPKPYPCTRFRVNDTEFDLCHPYVPVPLDKDRRLMAEEVARGMGPEAVLGVVGAPDLISWDRWHYDMDCEKPYTLIVCWDENEVCGIQKKTPVMWQTDEWDQEVNLGDIYREQGGLVRPETFCGIDIAKPYRVFIVIAIASCITVVVWRRVSRRGKRI
ncbi:MAG: hypothetical protein K9M57_05825 [Phycisphaerae bacterium]|nr:hypothetical protein [Phycisphaerae bacterium]